MSENVSQWLEEIKSLKQEIVRVEQEREAALASTDRWRGLYNTEAQQRRTQVEQLTEVIATLKAELEALQAGPSSSPRAIAPSELLQELAGMGPDELKGKLIEALMERDRLAQEISRMAESLEAEKVSHEQTRQTLTSALGDTVELLKKGQPGPKSGLNLDLARLVSGPSLNPKIEE
jgi:septal ring factor EnvC (AmiA/AmiB activator)